MSTIECRQSSFCWFFAARPSRTDVTSTGLFAAPPEEDAEAEADPPPAAPGCPALCALDADPANPWPGASADAVVMLLGAALPVCPQIFDMMFPKILIVPPICRYWRFRPLFQVRHSRSDVRRPITTPQIRRTITAPTIAPIRPAPSPGL